MNDSYYYEDSRNVNTWHSFYLKTYGKMALGLLLTAAVAFFGFWDLMKNYNHSIVYHLVTGFGPLLIGIVQIGLCIWMSSGLQNMKPSTAKIAYFAYCAATGLTLSTIPLYFGVTTVFTAILYTAVLFVSLLFIGMTTKIDISKFSGILTAGLITMLIMSLFSFFIRGSFFATIYDYIGVFLFMGITAWDAQNLKRYYTYAGDNRTVSNFATYAAFSLYLDFINIFLRVLSIFGRNQEN